MGRRSAQSTKIADMPSRPGAIRLFQISGITVFLHCRHLATAIFAVAVLPAAGTIWLFVRYRRTRSAFAIALQRFHDDRERGVGV